jgi:predicted nucleotidyltransferase
MDREEVARRLAENRDALRAFPIRSLSLFGSTVRGQARPDSDVDLLVEFDGPIGMFGFVRLQRMLGRILGRSVDLVPADAVKRQLREGIFGEAVRVA